MKYISVEDLKKLISEQVSINKANTHMLVEKAVDMVKVSDIKTLREDIAINYQFNSKMVTYQYMQRRLIDLITSQPKKHGGFTIEEWEQLRKLAYIKVETHTHKEDSLSNTDNVKITKLLPDPDNMERTNTNIPDGIKVIVTKLSNDIVSSITPLWSLNTIKHYMIVGKADE